MRLYAFFVTALAGGAAAGLAPVAFAAPPRPTNVPGVTTSAAPPPDFDAVNAGDDALSAYGFPPRPNAAHETLAYTNWANAVGAHPKRLVPQLQQTSVFHGPRLGRSSPAAGSNATSGNWSGYAVQYGASAWSAQSFVTIASNFIVPWVTARTCDANWEYLSAWVGIDGYASSDVLQAGIEADASCDLGVPATYFSPWYEWYPYSSTRITNLDAQPGQAFYVHVWATTASAGHAYLQNLTENTSVSIDFNAPTGTKLLGESAEWIVESPTVAGEVATLPNFGLDYFSGETSKTLGSKAVPPVVRMSGSTGSIPITLNRNGTNYSIPAPFGPAGIVVTSQ